MVDKMWTTGEVAKITGHSARTIAKWFDKGLVSGYLIPGGVDRRISDRSLREMAERIGMPLVYLNLPEKKCKTKSDIKP